MRFLLGLCLIALIGVAVMLFGQQQQIASLTTQVQKLENVEPFSQHQQVESLTA